MARSALSIQLQNFSAIAPQQMKHPGREKRVLSMFVSSILFFIFVIHVVFPHVLLIFSSTILFILIEI